MASGEHLDGREPSSLKYNDLDRRPKNVRRAVQRE